MRHNDPKTSSPEKAALTSTADEPLPSSGARTAQRSSLHLVIAWSPDEPNRVGEVAALDGERKTVLGRGGSQPDDGGPRATFHRVRPGQSTSGGPLVSQRISRSQLRFEPIGSSGEAVLVDNIGKTLLASNGETIDQATLRHGGVIVLRNAMVLLVVKRTRSIEPVRAYDHAFSFGASDAFGIVGESAAAWALRDSLAELVGSAKLGELPESTQAELLQRVQVPGLGERIEDVPLLVRDLLVRAAETSPQIAGRFMDRDGAKLDPALMEALLRHTFTTNVRELDRLLWTALSTSRGDFIEKTREVDEALAASGAASSRG